MLATSVQSLTSSSSIIPSQYWVSREAYTYRISIQRVRSWRPRRLASMLAAHKSRLRANSQSRWSQIQQDRGAMAGNLQQWSIRREKCERILEGNYRSWMKIKCKLNSFIHRKIKKIWIMNLQFATLRLWRNCNNAEFTDL